MVGNIEHAALQVGVPAEDVNYRSKNVVRINNGIVVGVDDLFTGAILEVGGVAGRGEAFEFFGIAFIVSGAVAAHGMQDDKGVFVYGCELFIQSVKQDVVMTIAAKAVGLFIAFFGVDFANAVADFFAAVVVVFPINIDENPPTTADNFRLVPHLCELQQRPTIDYDSRCAIAYGSGEIGMIQAFDICSGCTIPKFKTSNSVIHKLRVMPKCDGILAVASDEMSFVDVRDASNPAIIVSVKKKPIDFEPMRSEARETSVIIAYDDDTVTWLDMRQPEQEQVITKHSSLSAVDACYWGDYALVAGPNVSIIDLSNPGAQYSAIDGMYPAKQRPTNITSAAFHTSKPALGFVIEEKAIVIAGVLMDF